jgi:hypothetical protein
MRFLMTIVAIMLLTLAAHAEGGGRGKRNQQNAPKTEDKAKDKALDEAYKGALKSIPNSSKNTDPWSNMRQPAANK